MGIRSGNPNPIFLSDIAHMWDPRNPRGNIKVKTPTSSSTDYNAILGGIEGTVSDAVMLNSAGYLDFPTPTMTAGNDYGCQYFVDLAQIFEVDFWQDSGCTLQIWFYRNRDLVDNLDTNGNEIWTGSSDYNREHNILSERGNSALDHNHIFMLGSSTTSSYINYYNQNLTDAADRSIRSVGPFNNTAWSCFTVTCDGGPGYPNMNFYKNADRQGTIDQNLTQTSPEAPQEFGTIGLDPTTGTINEKPAMSFVGVLGPIIYWNRELTYMQVVDSYAQLYQSLPTPS